MIPWKVGFKTRSTLRNSWQVLLFFPQQFLWILRPQWSGSWNERTGCELKHKCKFNNALKTKLYYHNIHLTLFTWAEIHFSLTSVVPKGCVRSENAGLQRRCGTVCVLWSPTRQLALKLHGVQRLHREVADMRRYLILKHTHTHILQVHIQIWFHDTDDIVALKVIKVVFFYYK